MSAHRSLSLSAKINIGLLLFLLILAGAVSATVFYGFRRAQDDAKERSQQALEEQAKLTLQALVAGVAESDGLQVEWAAEIGQRAARYLDEDARRAPPVVVDVAGYARTDNGVWYDPDPRRATDVVIPNHVERISPAQVSDLEYSAPLAPLLPALFEGFPGELGGKGFRPIAVVFASVNGVGRYYPPIGVHETTPAEVNVSTFYDRFGPAANPGRLTNWTPPYEDVQGRGLVITAQSPVYEGQTFRGIFEVDLAVDGLVAELDGIRPTPGGFAFYVDTDGEVLRSAAHELLSAEAPRSQGLAAVLDAMRRGDAGSGQPSVEQVNMRGEAYLIAHRPLPAAGGSIAVAAPIDEATTQAASITAGISGEASRTLRTMLASLAGLFVLGLAGATYLNRQLLVGPLRRLASATRQVAGGDLQANVAVGRSDELGELAADFNVMVGRLRESEHVLEQRVADRTREIAGLLEVTRAVTSTLQIEPLLQLVLEQTASVLPYDRATIMLREGDELQILAVRAASGDADETLARQVGMRLSLARTPILWDALQAGEPVIIDDVHGDDRMAAAYRAEVGAYIGSAVERFRSWMGIPLMAKGAPTGIMVVARSERAAYEPAHAGLGKAIASQVAIAFENAQLFEQTQRQASLEERQRLARELHDSVSQALYGIALGTRTARMRLGDDPHNAAEPIDYVASLAQAGLAEMRALIFELRPESLEQEGLVAAIEKQAASVAARYKLAVNLDLGEEPACPIEVKEALYRIAQEALHNVVKHAQAQNIEVRLDRREASVELVVRDDGRGFDTAQPFPGHVGLRSMPERAGKLGGTVIIESAAGRGTTVRATLPVNGR